MDTKLEIPTDETEARLQKERDDAAMSYYQCGVMASDCETAVSASLEQAQALTGADYAAFKNKVIDPQAAAAYFANLELEKMRAAYDDAFNRHLEYIFKRDYVIRANDADLDRAAINRKR